MISELSDFLQSPFGQIVVRVICVLAIGVGIHAISIMGSGQKVVSKRVHFIAYILNIAGSVLVSYKYDRHELEMVDYVIEGILYGFGSVCFQYVLTHEKFVQILKIWRKK